MKERPTDIPENGFYSHYKHDPVGAFGNYMYEVVGLGRNTEEDTYTILYRPLYKSEWLEPANFCCRPYDMFVGSLEVNGKIVQRFRRITDTEVIKKLEKIKEEMYPVRF